MNTYFSHIQQQSASISVVDVLRMAYKDAMYKQLFAVNKLVSYKHVYQHETQVNVDSFRRYCWL